MTSYATHDEIVDAIARCEGRGNLEDGTYRIIPTWIGNYRVWMAEQLQESEGYEIGFDAVKDNGDLYIVDEFERYGVWTDESGRIFLDRTVHLKGVRAGVALDVARLYGQAAVYDWANGECISTKDPATALPVRTPALINLDQD